MKVIAIFSGKGGVGKSTITTLFALALSETKRVTILDLDANTPSMPVLFGNRKQVGNINIISSGFSSKGAILHSGSMLRSLIRDLADEALATKADVCLVDMPPGTSDIHMEVSQKLKPSSFLLVVQPNQLSYEDARRALEVFTDTGIPISGALVNMFGVLGKEQEEVCGLPVLANVAMREDIAQLSSQGKIDEVTDNPLSTMADSLLKDVTEVNWKRIRPALYRGVSEEDYFERKITGEKPTFVGLNTWELVRKQLMDDDISYPDQFLYECTTERIERMLNNLDSDNSGLFMVVRSPATEIVLFPGEIGMAILDKESRGSYYGVPRVKYQTEKGEVTMFPFEIMPVTNQDLLKYMSDGEHVRAPASSATRYLPTPEIMSQIEGTFRQLAHVPQDWEKQYEALGISIPVRR